MVTGVVNSQAVTIYVTRVEKGKPVFSYAETTSQNRAATLSQLQRHGWREISKKDFKKAVK